jgi:transglutaminase-like putative cysteine protease
LWLSGPSLAPAPSRTTARLGLIPNGEAGAQRTVDQMVQLAKDAVRDPQQKIREAAGRIIGNSSWVEQARKLQEWVATNIRYVRDPTEVELVQTPQYTLQQRMGDCDDQAVLLAAMLDSVGHPARFIAIGLNGQPLSHVMVQTLIGTQWAGAETIIPRPLGWMPPGITKWYIRKV